MKFIIPLLITFFTALFPLSIKEMLDRGHPNDYAIFEQNRTITAFIIHTISEKRITIEEISASSMTRPEGMSWKTWIERGAPGHTSWLIYDIDPKNGDLIDAYSFSKECFVSLSDAPPLPSVLLHSKLSSIPDSLRKRVGAKPSAVTLNDRAIWSPPLIINGERHNTPLTAYNTTWPDDGSAFSKKLLTLYYAPDFPFPHWIEVSHDYKLRVIDSGRELNTVTRSVPKRKPHILEINHQGVEWKVSLHNPSRLEKFSFYIALEDNELKEMVPIPIDHETSEGSETTLYLNKEVILPYCRSGETLSVIALSEEAPELLIEGSQKITWK